MNLSPTLISFPLNYKIKHYFSVTSFCITNTLQHYFICLFRVNQPDFFIGHSRKDTYLYTRKN